ncbi:hypothetical protein [Dietzia sp.]|uniref:hypothetical protein n=1 Tax=Dietzia sp. TaxID=1871616 RepID=UPI002FD9EC9A
MRHNHGDPAGAQRLPDEVRDLPASWAVAVPAKPLHRAKSRMSAQLPDAERRLLVRAMLGDVLEAVAGAARIGNGMPGGCRARVISFAVVTADPELAALARSLGAEIVPEFGPDVAAGLAPETDAHPAAPRAGIPSAGPFSAPAPVVSGGDSTFRRAAALGLDWAARRAENVAVLASDVPGITSADVAEVLEAAGAGPGASFRGYVPDADGLGTTAATFSNTVDLRTFFGPRSAADFAAAGAVALEPAPMGIRRDVDSLEHIAELGALGPRTAEALDRVGDTARSVMGGSPRARREGRSSRSTTGPSAALTAEPADARERDAAR